MFRETMTRTIPVAMIAMPVAWTDNVTMFVGLIICPPLRMSKASRITASATSIPNSRRSTSVCAMRPDMDSRGFGCV